MFVQLSLCLSVYGMDLWKGLGDELKESTNINHLKNYPKRNDWQIYGSGKVVVGLFPLGEYLDRT